MAKMLQRQIQWRAENWDHCVRSWSGARNSMRRPIWREHCRTLSTSPPPLIAADGYEIFFPRVIRRSEAYRVADEVAVDIWLDVPSEARPEPDIDGEIDPAELLHYDYDVSINIRTNSSWFPFSRTDLISHHRVCAYATGAGIAASVVTPSCMGGKIHFSIELPNGRTARYTVLPPVGDGSW